MYLTKEAELIYYRRNFLNNSVEKIGKNKDLIILIATTVCNEYSKKTNEWCFSLFGSQNIIGKDGGIYSNEKSFQYFTKLNKIPFRGWVNILL